MFANWRFFDFASCTDGTSQTLLLGEIGVAADGIPRLHTHVYSTPMKLADDPHKCFTAVDRQQTNLYKAGNHFQRGGRWADAGVTYSGFNTVLPPNSPSCVEPPENGAHPDWFGGVFSVGSFHAKGAHLTFVDGSVRFIGQSVNCETSSGVHASAYMGSVSQPGSESPYGVWGAMGTRGCADSAEVP
jgi:prepilin-type processing-associated H-X9-DG protein